MFSELNTLPLKLTWQSSRLGYHSIGDIQNLTDVGLKIKQAYWQLKGIEMSI